MGIHRKRCLHLAAPLTLALAVTAVITHQNQARVHTWIRGAAQTALGADAAAIIASPRHSSVAKV